MEWYSDCSKTVINKVTKTSNQDTTYCVNMAGISIDPAVLEQLKNKAPVNEIMLAFQAHHKEANLDEQILLCYAVHYQHVGFLREQKYFAYSEYSPYITAVYDQDEKMVEILQETCRTKNDARDFDDEKYGKIENNRILTDEKTTVWDIIFERDDIRMFRCLEDHFDCFYKDAQDFPLLCMAKRYDTTECIQFIKDYESDDTEKNPDHLLEIAIESSCSYVSSVSPVHRERAVRLWAYLENITTTPNHDKKFMTSDDEAFVRQLLACDSKIKEYCKQDVNPSILQLQGGCSAKDVSTLDRHSRIVLECCHTLLKTYLVPVPEVVLYYLMSRIVYSNRQVGYNNGRHVLSCQRNITLVNMMTKLYLQGTVMLEEENSSTHDDEEETSSTREEVF